MADVAIQHTTYNITPVFYAPNPHLIHKTKYTQKKNHTEVITVIEIIP